MTQNSGLATLREPIEEVLSKGLLVLAPPDVFRQKHFRLEIDPSLSRARRALDAHIRGGLVEMHQPLRKGRVETARFAYFQADIISSPVTVRDFNNRVINKPHRSRSADFDELIAFIGEFPGIAMEHTTVCTNSDIYGEGDDFSRLIGFTYFFDKKKREEGFEVHKLERLSKVLLPGDLVITRK